MIQQLIEISQEQYKKHKLEVDHLTQRIEEANWGDITTKNFAILNNIIDNYESDIIQRKNRKFRRDLRDYQQGRVYTFSKKYDQVPDINSPSAPQSCPNTIPSSEIESSDESEGDSTTRPRVNFLEETRRYRLGTLQDTRAKPLDIATTTPAQDLELNINQYHPSNLRPKSTFTPTLPAGNSIDLFSLAVLRDLDKEYARYCQKRKYLPSNLNHQQLSAIVKLRNNPNITIK
ncbi:hypothetical protein NDU88_000192 [Pleurodeles waltl]|uniref:Uncharacterized protein n=1 Tax=Pleurodeles waltl TaxID=8319 RepID=A0AAV7V697_PLEWA|nr:hypothetical protein NDU88_000192 [Pleurodeles waltl]